MSNSVKHPYEGMDWFKLDENSSPLNQSSGLIFVNYVTKTPPHHTGLISVDNLIINHAEITVPAYSLQFICHFLLFNKFL